MKRIFKLIFVCFIVLTTVAPLRINAEEGRDIRLMNRIVKEKEYVTEYVEQEYDVCSTSSVKTYMDYRTIDDVNSKQYRYIRDNMTVNQVTGLLEDEDGFIGVALGSAFGEIGDKYIFTLDDGKEFKFVKVEQKSDMHTVNGCYHTEDKSVIELVLNTTIAGQYYGVSSNNLILSGNFNNSGEFEGRIKSIVKIMGTVEVEVREPLELEENPLSVDNFFYTNNIVLNFS